MDIRFDYFNSLDGIRIRYAMISPGPKAAGAVILLGGRAEFIEKHLETIEELNRRCFDVYIMDWRGQGLSSRMLKDRHKGYVSSYEDYMADLRYFIELSIKPESVRPVIVLAHSMGAHIALRFLHDYPGIIDKAVLLSPMIDINTAPLPSCMVRWFFQLAKRYGLSEKYSIGAKNYNPLNRQF
jgi:lysophospholipase